MSPRATCAFPVSISPFLEDRGTTVATLEQVAQNIIRDVRNIKLFFAFLARYNRLTRSSYSDFHQINLMFLPQVRRKSVAPRG